MASDTMALKRRTFGRFAGGGLALLVAPALTACGNEEEHKIKGLKMQVQEKFGTKEFGKGLDLAQKGFALARKHLGDKAPDTLYFAQAISENQLRLRNIPGAVRALKQEVSLRSAAGQPEKKLQIRRTMLIQLAEETGDTATAVDQTVIIAKSIEMGPGKDPQPTYQPMPDYPPAQYRDRVEGDVDIGFNLEADGTPTAIRVKSSAPPNVFDSAAMEAIRKWRFTPFIKDGQPVSSTGHHYTLVFRLRR